MADQPAQPAGPGAVAKASFGQRFLGWLVDVILLGVVGFVLQAIVGQALGGILNFLVGVGYYVYFEGSPSGQTLGKRAIGIRVVDARSLDRIDSVRAFIRYIGKIISGIPCALGYFWMLWDDEKQTWHDKIATTYVVPAANYPVESWPGY